MKYLHFLRDPHAQTNCLIRVIVAKLISRGAFLRPTTLFHPDIYRAKAQWKRTAGD